MKQGINLRLLDSSAVYIDDSVILGDNVTIYENNRLTGNTVIGDNCVLMPGNILTDCIIGADNTLTYTVADGCQTGKGCQIGPFARLRKGTVLGDDVRIGNFVEVKNSSVSSGTKAAHLSYIGDADLGKKCNVGCGAIFVNYDGRVKHRSRVGDECFVGSNVNVVAPVSIGDGAYICAGTTVTEDAESGDFVIGRARQINKSGRAAKYRRGE